MAPGFRLDGATWRAVAAMPEGERPGLYDRRPRRRTDRHLATFDAFDPATGRWTGLSPMPTARGGLSAAATCNGFLVAAGGEAQATFPQAEAYDLAAGGWRALPPTPTPRHG
jgi:hypothetical protein